MVTQWLIGLELVEKHNWRHDGRCMTDIMDVVITGTRHRDGVTNEKISESTSVQTCPSACPQANCEKYEAVDQSFWEILGLEFAGELLGAFQILCSRTCSQAVVLDFEAPPLTTQRCTSCA